MRIVYLLKSFAQMAGVERVMADKMNFLASHGHEVWLVTYEQGAHPLAFPLHDAIRHTDLDTRFFTLSRYPLWARYYHHLLLKRRFRAGLGRLVADFRPDVLLTTTYSLKLARDVARFRDRTKLLIESHVCFESVMRQDDFRNRPLYYWPARVYDALNLRVLRRFDRLIALTEKDARRWREHLSNVSVIPNPVTRYPETPGNGTPPDCRIIAVGRLNHQKGFAMLIEAFAGIADRFPLWRVDIFGQGELHDELQAQIGRAGLTGRVSIHKPTPNIYNEYMRSRLFVLSSRFEGFGLVLVEAMACGVPCVSFDCPYGPDEIITDGIDGLLAESGNVAQLASKMEWMMSHEAERQAMGLRAHESARRYEIHAVMRQWDALLDELLN